MLAVAPVDGAPESLEWSIREIYFVENRVMAWTDSPQSPTGESAIEFGINFEMMRQDLDTGDVFDMRQVPYVVRNIVDVTSEIESSVDD